MISRIRRSFSVLERLQNVNLSVLERELLSEIIKLNDRIIVIEEKLEKMQDPNNDYESSTSMG